MTTFAAAAPEGWRCVIGEACPVATAAEERVCARVTCTSRAAARLVGPPPPAPLCGPVGAAGGRGGRAVAVAGMEGAVRGAASVVLAATDDGAGGGSGPRRRGPGAFAAAAGAMKAALQRVCVCEGAALIDRVRAPSNAGAISVLR